VLPAIRSAVIINSTTRTVLAFLSTLGFAGGALAYALTFRQVPTDTIFPWMGLLCVGMMLLFSPIFVLEYPQSRAPSSFYLGFARGLPGWVAPCEWILALIALTHIIWFALHSGLGVPAVQDGEYVIESRGHILRVISQAEFLALKEAALRMFSTMMVSFYYVPMAYWWFRRNDRPR
jgi:hypothetical protein